MDFTPWIFEECTSASYPTTKKLPWAKVEGPKWLRDSSCTRCQGISLSHLKQHQVRGAHSKGLQIAGVWKEFTTDMVVYVCVQEPLSCVVGSVI